MSDQTALAIDIGGSKTLVALVRGPEVLEEVLLPTAVGAGPATWVDEAARAAGPFAGRYACVAAAVTGLVDDGRWSALNSGTLAVGESFPLAARLADRLGCTVSLVNDAQAAAWGEHRFGAGRANSGHDPDMVFVTLSTGIGGGIIRGGRLVRGRGGLAGHLGIMSATLDEASPVEDIVAGRWIAAEASRAGHSLDARGVFAAAGMGAPWAMTIVARSAERSARLLANLQLILAPDLIVVGGGIGLAAGHLDTIRGALASLSDVRRPTLVAATLGLFAGVLGAGDLALADRARAGSIVPSPSHSQRRLA